MKVRGKKYKQSLQKANKLHTPIDIKDAITKVVGTAYAKFDETLGVDIVLGIDPTRGDQVVRGSVLLPHGTGKTVVVAAFVPSNKEAEAKAAGADFVGGKDLIDKVDAGWVGFDIAVATPDMMAQVGRVAKVLGPKGILPNKKSGTVDENIGILVTEIKKGKFSFRNDKGGGLHTMFGKVSMGVSKLTENLEALLDAVRASKPASSKGRFFRKVVVSSTMGVGFVVKAE